MRATIVVPAARPRLAFVGFFGIMQRTCASGAPRRNRIRWPILLLVANLVLAAITLVSASAEARSRLTLSQLPPIVAKEIRGGEQTCRNRKMRPVYRLNEVVHEHSLSGRRTRDYIVDLTKLHCRARDGFMSHAAVEGGICGSGGCGLSVYLQPRRGRWVEYGALVIGWHVTRRAGKKTLLVMRVRCYGDPAEPCRGRDSYNHIVRVRRDGTEPERP